MVDDVEILHHLDTNIDDESELCRKILTKSCDTDHGKLEIDIHTPGNPRLNLFRGFSRFMYEDLALHPFTTKLSKKKFKKLVSKVGFEMIKVCFYIYKRCSLLIYFSVMMHIQI